MKLILKSNWWVCIVGHGIGLGEIKAFIETPIFWNLEIAIRVLSGIQHNHITLFTHPIIKIQIFFSVEELSD